MFQKWTPAVPIRRPDNIISSKAREKGDFGFVPKYESEPVQDMWHIMTHEYKRLWVEEKAVYEKQNYTREKIIREENKIRRKFVQRMMTYRKPSNSEDMENSIKNRILSKHPDQLNAYNENKYIHYKFKPDCESEAEKKKKREDPDKP